MWKRAVAVLLCLALALTWGTALGDVLSVEVRVTFAQTEARRMLEMINSFRTGPDAWQWNEDNSEQVYFTDLEPLSYDLQLEQAAMQRAAELAVSYSHTRPDGSDCDTAVDEAGVDWWSVGENIAVG